MNLTTPALLFGSISLLLVAYTNRFSTLAKYIRELYENNLNREQALVDTQIPILRKRIRLIKRMQTLGIISFILCTVSMFALFFKAEFVGKFFFAVSVLTLLNSLVFALFEISMSTKALDIILENTERSKSVKTRKNNN